MANKQALRELQSRLAERLQAARTQERGKSWLAVECSARGFLFPLRDAGEIFPVAPLAPVPHSHPWFLGVSNLRGHLHGVVDLGGFLGLNGHGGPREQSRLVGFNQSGPRPGFAGARYRDASSRLWQELNLAALAGDEAFLGIVG